MTARARSPVVVLALSLAASVVTARPALLGAQPTRPAPAAPRAPGAGAPAPRDSADSTRDRAAERLRDSLAARVAVEEALADAARGAAGAARAQDGATPSGMGMAARPSGALGAAAGQGFGFAYAHRFARQPRAPLALLSMIEGTTFRRARRAIALRDGRFDQSPGQLEATTDAYRVTAGPHLAVPVGPLHLVGGVGVGVMRADVRTRVLRDDGTGALLGRSRALAAWSRTAVAQGAVRVPLARGARALRLEVGAARAWDPDLRVLDDAQPVFVQPDGVRLARRGAGGGQTSVFVGLHGRLP